MSEKVLFLVCWLIDSACVGLRGIRPDTEQWNLLRASVCNLVDGVNTRRPNPRQMPPAKFPDEELDVVPSLDPESPEEEVARTAAMIERHLEDQNP